MCSIVRGGLQLRVSRWMFLQRLLNGQGWKCFLITTTAAHSCSCGGCACGVLGWLASVVRPRGLSVRRLSGAPPLLCSPSGVCVPVVSGGGLPAASPRLLLSVWLVGFRVFLVPALSPSPLLLVFWVFAVRDGRESSRDDGSHSLNAWQLPQGTHGQLGVPRT